MACRQIEEINKYMTWTDILAEYEKSKKWQEGLALLEGQIQKEPNNCEAYVRIIYLIHNLLVDEDYEKYGFDHYYLSSLLLKYYKESFPKCKEDVEYIFFLGNVMHIAEWYFDEKDNTFAIQLQKKAMDMEPDNLLFKFCYELSISNDMEELKTLATEIYNQSKYLDWSSKKGYPGRYAIGKVKAVLGMAW
jgi:tetratricopeptide (TPR) repeat protein